MDLEALGNRIRSLRMEKLHMSQEEFANKLNIDRTYLSRVESGKQNITTEMLIKICEEGLSVSLMDFFNFDDAKLINKISKECRKIKFIDLFAGMGGTRLGFEQAAHELGFETECVLTSEIKESAIEAYKLNFGDENIFGDIRKIDETKIPDFDFLLGGFPCQAFSTAGKGLGFLDTRGTLFFEIERILKYKKPKGFLLENVEGLVNHDKEKKDDPIGRTLNTILKKLELLGYNVTWKLINSKNFGVAQSRYRVYIVGSLKEKISLDNFEVKNKTIGEILEKNLPCVQSHFTKCLFNHFKPNELYGKSIKDKRGGENNIHSWTIGLKGEISEEQKIIIEKLFKERRKKHWAEEIGIKWMDGMPLTLEQIKTFHNSNHLKEMLDDLVAKGYLVMEHPKELMMVNIGDSTIEQRVQDESKPKGYNIVAGKLSFEFTKILDNNDVAPTLVAMDVSKLGVVDGNGIRHLSIREGLRLFGYPESYQLSMFENCKNGLTKAFDLLGNTIVVPVVYNIALRLIQCYN